jgi:hypothetical protein
LALVLTAAPASAQTKINGDLGIGYSFLKWVGEETIPLGWNASVAGKVNERVSAVADFGGHYLSESGDFWSGHTSTGGVRVHAPRTAQVIPFAQATFGLIVGHESGDTDFAWVFQPGAGIDVPFQPGGAAFRTQVDFPYYFRGGDGVWSVRWSAGVVIPIK